MPKFDGECPNRPVSDCSIDVECPGNQKCCDDGCLGFKCADRGKSPSYQGPFIFYFGRGPGEI